MRQFYWSTYIKRWSGYNNWFETIQFNFTKLYVCIHEKIGIRYPLPIYARWYYKNEFNWHAITIWILLLARIMFLCFVHFILSVSMCLCRYLYGILFSCVTHIHNSPHIHTPRESSPIETLEKFPNHFPWSENTCMDPRITANQNSLWLKIHNIWFYPQWFNVNWILPRIYGTVRVELLVTVMLEIYVKLCCLYTWYPGEEPYS